MGDGILVVEDETDLQEALQVLLELEGYAVRQAKDGVEALEQVQAARPQLIVLDMMMPRMNGYEFLAELERRNQRSGISILVLTAGKKALEDTAQLGVEAGIAKPFDVAVLLDEISRLMRAHKQE